MENLKLILIGLSALLSAVLFLLFFYKSLKKKKIIETFGNFFSRSILKNELIMALNNYEQGGANTDYYVQVDEVHNKLVHTHMKELSNSIVFGRDYLNSQICIYDPAAESVEFAVFLDQNTPSILCLSENGNIHLRVKKKHGRNVPKSFSLPYRSKIALFTGDSILVGEKRYTFTIWNCKKGIR